MRRIAFMVSILVAVVVAAPAMAQTETITIEVDGVTRGAAGSIKTVAEHTVDPELVGLVCTGTTRTGNNASEHAGNDFILSSGSSTTVIPDWERVAGAVVSSEMTLVLGETIRVDLRLGSDGISSGMVSITLSCAQPEPPETTTTTTTAPPPTTTVPPPTTTTTAPPPPTTQPPATTTTTVPPATTTTEPPPEGGVSAGGGSTAAGTGNSAAWLGGGAFTVALAALLVAFARRARDITDGD